MNGRLGTPRGIQTASAKCRVALIYIIYKYAVYGTEDTIPGMTRKLQFGSVANQVNDSVGHLALLVPGPFVLEVEDFSIKAQRSPQIARSDYGHNLHKHLRLLSANARQTSSRLSRSFPNQPANDMALPHPQSYEDQCRKKDIPNGGRVIGSVLRRIIYIADDWNAADDVNPAKDRTFGSLSHRDSSIQRLCRVHDSSCLRPHRN